MASPELLEWCETGRVHVQGIAASTVDEGGRGLVAVEDLPPGAPLPPPPEVLVHGWLLLLPPAMASCCYFTGWRRATNMCPAHPLARMPHPCPVGSCILRVPRKLLMSVESARRDAQLAEALQQCGQGLTSEQASWTGGAGDGAVLRTWA